MIQITRPESANDGIGRSLPELDHGESAGRPWKGPAHMVEMIERFVADRPGLCLGTALSLGIALGWWVKRK